MKGWKTWTGATIIGLSAALKAVGGEYEQYAEILVMVGGVFGLVGIGHKADRAAR